MAGAHGRQTVMGSQTRIACVDFPEDWTDSVVLLRLVAIVSGAKLVW